MMDSERLKPAVILNASEGHKQDLQYLHVPCLAFKVPFQRPQCLVIERVAYKAMRL